METNKIFFNAPATQWDEALPLGNGRLGAMVFGIPDREQIQLNEDSIWSGGFRDRNNPAARESLGEIRRLLYEGKAAEAEELCLESFSGIPPAQRVYQTAGELQINFSPDAHSIGGFGLPWSGTRDGPLLKNVTQYHRELNIATALQTTTFEYQDTHFTRECFISASAQLLVLRFSAATKDGCAARGKISFWATLNRGVFYDRKGNIADATNCDDGNCAAGNGDASRTTWNTAAFIARDGDIPFCVMFKVAQKGGVQKGRGGFITVENADEALLFLDIRTGFNAQYTMHNRTYDMEKCDCTSACLENINRHAGRSWDELLQEHIDEYKTFYYRMELNIDTTPTSRSPLPIPQYFNFCRYLLISCSRPGTNAANLQGLWNHHFDPPWGCDYTININTQMNYWAACMCNLAEMEEPLFDLLERMYPNGKHTAQVMYGCRGFTAHHNTDIWGDTAVRDYWLPGSYWVLGAAWLSLHIWEHFEYTMDKEFLQKYFYLLKEACIFFVDFLIPSSDGRTNEAGESYLIVSPSVSPENSYLTKEKSNKIEESSEQSEAKPTSLCAGCEMDNQILRKLFDATIRAAQILEEQNDDIAAFQSVLGRIAKPTLHSNGGIREWNEEFAEAEPGHRHFSHLFALYPADYITPADTPELAAAAGKSIDNRLAANGGQTGWSRAWLVNFFARLGDGQSALENLNAIFKEFTLPNLFNTHPPFQIDGNFGALAGITQMIVQSRMRKDGSVVVELLPALPEEWSSGSVKGVRVKGNLILDFEWKDGKLTSLGIENKNKTTITVTVSYENYTANQPIS